MPSNHFEYSQTNKNSFLSEFFATYIAWVQNTITHNHIYTYQIKKSIIRIQIRVKNINSTILCNLGMVIISIVNYGLKFLIQ